MSLTVLCHYSEIGLKKRNRAYFERIFENNIRQSLRSVLPDQEFKVIRDHKRYLLQFKNDVDFETVQVGLDRVFGLAYYAPVAVCSPTIEELEATALKLMEKRSEETFAVRCRRVDKSFPLKSNEVNVRLGAAIVEKLGKKVNLTEPQVTCSIEITKDKALVSVSRIKGPGGLPVGASGKVLVLLSGGFDSPVAAFLALKRGARCTYIHFHSYPYTNKFSQEKVLDLARILNRYQFHSKLLMVPFAQTQEEIVFNSPDRFRVILYRRFMMRIAERIAKKEGLKAVVTGESLGQVASQTLENLAAIEQVITMPVLRPLIGMDKNEIIALSRKIGTYDISVKPHDDACTRFMPRQPETRARLEDVLKAEAELDVERLVEEAINRIETVEI